MIDTINTYLVVLNNLIATYGKYDEIYQYIIAIKRTGNSSFAVYTEEGIANLLLVLEDINLVVHGQDINLKEELDRLTVDFSILSGMSDKQWSELVDYLYNSHRRSMESQYRFSDSTDTRGKELTILMKRYPWTITLLLLEVLIVQRPVAQPRRRSAGPHRL